MLVEEIIMSEKKTFKNINFLLVGVGGQGTLLASDILAELGVRLGYDAKKAEIHGMSQRGGSVTSYVRWGGQVFSPIIGKGEVDILVAFEKLEALRYLDQLRPGGIVLVNPTDQPTAVSALPWAEKKRENLPAGQYKSWGEDRTVRFPLDIAAHAGLLLTPAQP